MDSCKRQRELDTPVLDPQKETFDFVDEGILSQLTQTIHGVVSMASAANSMINSIETSLRQLNTWTKEWQDLETEAKIICDKKPNIIKLDLRGKVFKVRKEVLLSAKYSYFHALLSTDTLKPNKEGAYFLDINPEGFDKILIFLEGDIEHANNLPPHEERQVASLNQSKTTDNYYPNYNSSITTNCASVGEVFLIPVGETFTNITNCAKNCMRTIRAEIAALTRKTSHWKHLLERLQEDNAAASTIVCLDLKGKVYKTTRKTLMRTEGTYFHAMLSSGAWQPDEDGSYYIDRWYYGFDRLLELMSSGQLHFDGLTPLEIECCKNNWEYFQLKRPSVYSRHISYICAVLQLQDGRLCSGSSDGEIKIWNSFTSDCDLILKGHKERMSIIQLNDGRLCSSSVDGTIRLWSVTKSTCEQSISSLNGDTFDIIVEISDEVICLLVYEDSEEISLKVMSYCLNTSSWLGTIAKSIDDDDNVKCLARFNKLGGNRLILGTEQGQIFVYYNMVREASTSPISQQNGCIEFLAQINEDTFCSISEDEHYVVIWNLELLVLKTTKHTANCCGASFGFGCKFILGSAIYFFCLSEKALKYIDLQEEGGEERKYATALKCLERRIEIMIPLASGSICTAYCFENLLRVWEIF